MAMMPVYLGMWKPNLRDTLSAVFVFLFFQAVRLEPTCSGGERAYPDPTNCARYYLCDGVRPVLMSCPQGLLFNGRQLWCDWPHNVNCNEEMSTTEEQITTSGMAATSIEPNPTAEETTRIVSTMTTGEKTQATEGTTMQEITSTILDSNSEKTTESIVQTTTEQESTTSEDSVNPGCEELDDDWEKLCKLDTAEPITPEIQDLREYICIRPNNMVECVRPGSSTNPANVRVLESVFPEAAFDAVFPEAHAAYTYSNLLKAFAKFPRLCREEELCRRTLAVMFAHFQQETAGLYYIKEINRADYCANWTPWVATAFPCAPGQKYFGRGAKQLSWNYNYGAFSAVIYGDAKVLLENPDLVSDTWLNFASALWFYVTPQPPKPSMQAVVEDFWLPSNADIQSNRVPGFGATTMIINGALECGSNPSNPTASTNRQNYYRIFADYFNVSIPDDEKLDCRDMTAFDWSNSNSNTALYWAPESACGLASWQTAFSALWEGQHDACLQLMK